MYHDWCLADCQGVTAPVTLLTVSRDDLLLEWVTTITDLSLHLQHDNLQDLRVRTLDLLPPSLRDLVGGGERRAAPSTGKR